MLLQIDLENCGIVQVFVNDNGLEVHSWKVYWSDRYVTDGFYDSVQIIWVGRPEGERALAGSEHRL